MPSSMTSAPQASRRRSASAVVARSGSPAVIYGMNAVYDHARQTKLKLVRNSYMQAEATI
jgi:hypothetical protein